MVLTEIGTGAFSHCGELRSIVIPESVTKIADDAFSDCPKLTFICHEGSCTHQFCQENHFTFIFDYQYEAFHGLLPPGIEKLASPFLADEEKPYIFISYSHKDRDAVLGIIKTLYESGWKVWYDEGLTIGDRYDETLENHVKNCAAFLLFVTEHSIGSFYVRENEIPWAIDSGKPIIKCILDEGTDYEIREDSVAATVSPAEIEPALEKIRGLVKGERRTAKGISVVVNPADREDSDGGGYAFCLYSAESSASAQTILLEARNSGCTIYDAGKEGIDESLLQNSACLVVFLDKAFLSEGYLTEMLIKEYQSAKDIAVCQLEDIEDDDLPQELLGLHMMQWLNFVHGITGDMNTKLARHLQKRGCRNSAILPGFEYEETDKGIVIRRYTGIDPSPRIESEYGGRPVLEIADKAFENCIRLKQFVIPDGVKIIGQESFSGCTSLTSVVIPDSVTEIRNNAFDNCTNLSSVAIGSGLKETGDYAFRNCQSLTSIILPGSLSKIGNGTFYQCKNLTSVTIPDGVTEIGESAFYDCRNLPSVTIPDSVTEIGNSAFSDCRSLISITIPNRVTKISHYAFSGCKNLASVFIPSSVTEIGGNSFSYCPSLASIILPDSLREIGYAAFSKCTGLTSIVLPDSVTKIGTEAFGRCKSMVSAVISKNLTEISGFLFSGCSSLSSVVMPEGVAEIKRFAFDECISLVSIVIPEGVRKIEEGAFEKCTSLTAVTIPESVTEFGKDPFKYCKNLTVSCPPDSCAWKYCREHNIPVKSSRPGFFSRIFGRK